jgi:hypothetical protein
MLITRTAEITIEPDEPVAALWTFARTLRAGAILTDGARIEPRLLATSARGLKVLRDFKPDRARSVDFANAIAMIEELAQLPIHKVKSLHLIISAMGFRWKGSPLESTGSLVLLDGKSFRHKQRFRLAANLSFESPTAEGRVIEELLQSIESKAGLRFSGGSGFVQMSVQDAARATDAEVMMTALSWHELIESLTELLRGSVELKTVPHLMTAFQAIRYLGDPERARSCERIYFSRHATRWIKAEFQQYLSKSRELADGYFERAATADTLIGFAIDKKAGRYGKSFTISVSVALTSKRFAPSVDRPARMAVQLSRLYGIAPLPFQWTFDSAKDLSEAFSAATQLLRPVLELLEAEAPKLASAHLCQLSEFAGPRHLSARQAHEVALLRAREWAGDASPIALGAAAIEVPFPWPLAPHPPLDPAGRLCAGAAWSLTFHSQRKEENLFVRVPCHGTISLTTMDAPAGRQYPSDVDHILRQGWVDSPETLRVALATAQQLLVTISAANLLSCELRSEAAVPDSKMPLLPLRNGMFDMRAWWRMRFSDPHPQQTRRIEVRVPAYGDGTPRVEIRLPDGRLLNSG